ncbi:MAG: translation initiation factor IF-2 N-terminal domain-containing protein, partial [Nocardioides sp.]
MAKTRVHELAKEFGVESKFVLEKFKEMGEFVKSASSTVELPAEMRFRKEYGDKLKSEAASAPAEAPAAKPAPAKKAPAKKAAVPAPDAEPETPAAPAEVAAEAPAAEAA